MSHIKFAGVVVFCLFLQACGGVGPIKQYQENESILVYGNLTYPDRVVNSITLYEYGVVYVTPFKNPPRAHVYNNGNFFFERLKPGKYYLKEFMSGNTIYDMGFRTKEAIDKVAFTIKPGDMLYLGSYKIANEKGSFFGAGSFEIQVSNKPTEREILKHMAEVMKEKGWGGMINSRMSSLKK